MPRRRQTSKSTSSTKPYNKPEPEPEIVYNIPAPKTIRNENTSSRASGTRTPDAATILNNQVALAAAAGDVSLFRPLTGTETKHMSIETSTVKPHRLATPAFRYLHRIDKDQIIDDVAFQEGLKAIYGIASYIVTTESNGTAFMVHGSKQHPYDLLAELRKLDVGAVWQVCLYVHYIPKSEIRNQEEFELALSTLYRAGHVYMINAAKLIAVHVSQQFPTDLLAALKIMRLGGVWMSDDIPLFHEW